MTSQDKDKHVPALAPGPRGQPKPSSTPLVPGPRKISVACLPCKQAKRKVSYRHIRRVSLADNTHLKHPIKGRRTNDHKGPSERRL